MDYGSEVWGFKNHVKLNMVQQRAIRYYLGVNKFTPIHGLYGECSWLLCKYRQWGNMIRYWNRLVKLDDNRLTKKIFQYDVANCGENWSGDILKIVNELNLGINIYNYELCNMEVLSNSLKNLNDNYLWDGISKSAKLRTYRKFKYSISEENYLIMFIPRNERAKLAQFRLGVLPIRVETGRYKGEPLDARVCQICNLSEIEDELHFLCKCDKYSKERSELYNLVANSMPLFNICDDEEKMVVLLREFPRQTARYLNKVYQIRVNIINKNK